MIGPACRPGNVGKAILNARRPLVANFLPLPTISAALWGPDT
jgi:hypothetical protein